MGRSFVFVGTKVPLFLMCKLWDSAFDTLKHRVHAVKSNIKMNCERLSSQGIARQDAKHAHVWLFALIQPPFPTVSEDVFNGIGFAPPPPYRPDPSTPLEPLLQRPCHVKDKAECARDWTKASIILYELACHCLTMCS